MDQEADPLSGHLRVMCRDPSVALGSELHHGVRNGVVQTAIQGEEFVDGERRVTLEGQVRDGLAEVSMLSLSSRSPVLLRER